MWRHKMFPLIQLMHKIGKMRARVKAITKILTR